MRFNRKWLLMLLAMILFGPAVSPAARQDLAEGWEKTANQRHPPNQVMDLIGLKPGMMIGELGAGGGRFTVHLARRVGGKGIVFANDINPKAIEDIRARCRRQGITNIETVLGREDDPRFPKTNLDMVFMVWVYHMMEKPVDMLRSLIPYMKPGALVAMLEPIPAETEEEIKDVTARTGKIPTDVHVVTKESLEKDAAAVGLEFVRMDSTFKMDNLFILRVKAKA